MAALRIVLVSETFLPSAAGGPTADAVPTTTLRAIVDRLVDTGHEVLVVAPGPGLATYRGVRVHRVTTLDKAGAQVRAALDAFAPDVALLSSPGRLGRKALKHAHAVGLPTLVVEQSPLLDTSVEYWRRKVARRADRVVVTSHWMRERVGELGLDAPVWSPGVDTAAFTPALRDDWLHASWSRRRSREGGLVVVGYVGGLHRRHGVRRLAELADVPGIRPVLIGDGPERGWLASRLPQAKVLGTLSTGDLGVALPSLDLLVHPGEHQTCAHVLREAAASGVPVVAPRSGGAREVVRHQETGLLYDTGRRRGLARTVDALAADPHRRFLGGRAREIAAGRTWQAAVDELVTLHLAPLARPATSVQTPRRAPRETRHPSPRG